MSRKFLRCELDDIGKRKLYESRVLNGRTTTIDAYTGKKIYKNNRYTPHRRLNTDHVIPIKQAYSLYGDYLTAKELREILAQDYNLAITNERLNKAKGCKSNLKFIIDNFGNLDSYDLNVIGVTKMLLHGTNANFKFNKAAVTKILSNNIRICEIKLNDIS